MPPPRIIDERTGEPVDYAVLSKEAETTARDHGITVPAAERMVAEKANADHADSIVRHLVRVRSKDAKPSDGAPTRSGGPPLPGWGAWAQILHKAASQLENRWLDIGEREQHTKHQAKIFHRQARALYDAANRRLDHLESIPSEQAADALRDELGDLEAADPALAPVAFIEAEKAAALAVLHMTSRVAIAAEAILKSP